MSVAHATVTQNVNHYRPEGTSVSNHPIHLLHNLRDILLLEAKVPALHGSLVAGCNDWNRIVLLLKTALRRQTAVLLLYGLSTQRARA